MTGSAEGKVPGAGTAEHDKTKQGAKATAAGAGQQQGPRGAETGDSPKRQGDKLEHATKAAGQAGALLIRAHGAPRLLGWVGALRTAAEGAAVRPRRSTAAGLG